MGKPLYTGTAMLLTWFFVATALADPSTKKQSLDRWIAELKSDDPKTRAEATKALSKLGPDDESAVAGLIKSLEDKNADVRALSARALGKIGRQADTVIPALFAAMNDGNLSSAAQTHVWAEAAIALGKGFGPEALPRLIKAIEDKNVLVRRRAAVALHHVGPQAKSAVPALIRLLDMDERLTRNAAIYGLLGIGPDAKAAVPALLKKLDSDDFHTQYWACRALGRMGREAKVATPVLLRLLKQGVTSVRRNAAAALGNIGPAVGENAVQPLIDALADRIQPVREQAAIALGKLGPLAKPAVPLLKKALTDKSFGPQVQAAESLWRISGETELSVKVLVRELRGLQAPLEAGKALGRMGPAAKAAASALVEMLKSNDGSLRQCAAEALGGIGKEAKAALPDLKKLLNDADPEVQAAAIASIKRITVD